MPKVDPAPARLSTTTAWPSFLPSCSAITRATMSLAPPAGKVTTILIGLSGQAAQAGTQAAAAPAARVLRAVRRDGLNAGVVRKGSGVGMVRLTGGKQDLNKAEMPA